MIIENQNKDVAILYIPSIRHPKVTKLNTSLVPESKVTSVGFPLGIGLFIHEGRLGYKDPKTGLMTHSAETHPGNSGGPVFNEELEMIGISIMIPTFTNMQRGIIQILPDISLFLPLSEIEAWMKESKKLYQSV
jgi:S1-C subfamily serine protease